MAQRHGNILHDFTRQFANALFVRAIGIGIHETDGDGFDALVLQLRQRGTRRTFIERSYFLALRIHPPANRHGVFERRQRCRFGPDDPCRKAAGNIGPGDLHDIAIAFGHDQADAGPFAFKHGIGGNGGAVEEIFDFRRLHPRIGADRGHAVQYPLAAVVRRRGCLVAPECTGVGIEQQQVGKCPADVHAQTIPHYSLLKLLWGNVALARPFPAVFFP